MSLHQHFLGYACGIGAHDTGCADGPPHLFKKLKLHESLLLYPEESPNKYSIINEICKRLSNETLDCIQQKKFFTVIGGDHSCAIGTWSGAAHALRHKGDLGLIWIDAHFDAHIPKTSPSGNIHGMPVAALLGHGHPLLTQIQDNLPKIKPENLCMIGMRSYESPEQELIKKLNIKVFYSEEVLKHGFGEVYAKAKEIVTKNTIHYGISLDLDAIDPKDAPGVGTPSNNGIPAKDIIDALSKYSYQDKKLLGWEIAEFNPNQDVDEKTEKLIVKLLESMNWVNL
jgi:arginase